MHKNTTAVARYLILDLVYFTLSQALEPTCMHMCARPQICQQSMGKELAQHATCASSISYIYCCTLVNHSGDETM